VGELSLWVDLALRATFSLSAICSPMSLVFHEDSKYATLEIERYVLLVVPS
jgi:hypothetical protein